MKFNLLLLLLTTFIAVVSSQIAQVPTPMQIQSATTGLFWALDGDNIVAKPQGTNWIIHPYAEGSFISPVGISGKSIQYNGDDRRLTIAENNSTSFDQRWIFLWIFNPGQYQEKTPVAICSSQDPYMCATISGVDVVADPEELPQWILYDA